jgi:hypothetical protein
MRTANEQKTVPSPQYVSFDAPNFKERSKAPPARTSLTDDNKV